MASMLLGSIGSSIAGPLGGFIGSALGSYIDNMLFGPKGEEQGKVNDINVTRADPGDTIPLVYGADRINGILMASTPLLETKHKEGGKGGPSVTVYTYHVTCDFLLCEGPILGVGRIWAEGNAVRATRYEFSIGQQGIDEATNQPKGISTEFYPQNVGGISYPSYYRDHLYEPSLIPWVMDKDTIANDDGKYYIMLSGGAAMQEISSATATTYLNNHVQTVYWRDLTTGYYIPFEHDHAYGVDFTSSSIPAGAGGGTYTVMAPAGPGNTFANQPFYTVIDLHTVIPPGYSIGVGEFSACYIKWFSEVSICYAFGVNVSQRVMTISFKYYKDGNNQVVNGTQMGTQIGNELINLNLTECEQQGSNGVAPPADTRFIVIDAEYALLFPIFAGDYASTIEIILGWGKPAGSDTSADRDWPSYWNLYDAINDWSDNAVLTMKGADNIRVYYGKDEQLPDTAMATALDQPVPAYVNRAHIVFDTLQLADYGNRIPSFSFEVVQYDDVRHKDVIVDLFSRAGLDDTYYDVDSLPEDGQTSQVLGYSITSSTSLRSAMEQVLEAFRIDVSEVGDELLFRERDRDVDYIIDYNDLAAMEPGKRVDPAGKIEYTLRDPTELPKTLTTRFKDVERMYQPNSARWGRAFGDGIQISSADLPLVLPSSMAKAWTQDKMHDLWYERISVRFKLPPKYAFIYPTDIVQINGAVMDADDLTVKITRRTRGVNGIFDIEAVLHVATLYVPKPGEVRDTNMDNSTWNQQGSLHQPQVAFVAPIMLDLPPLLDTAQPIGFYFGISASDDFAGATLYRSVDGGITYSAMVTANARATAGYTGTSALLPVNPGLYDDDSVIYVQLDNATDTLSSITIEQLYAGFNACVIGNEVVQFTSAILQGDGTYKLTGFMRGLRGTDDRDIPNTHVNGERFVLLSIDTIYDLVDFLGSIGAPSSYKLVATGSTLAAATAFSFTNTGQRNKPLSPTLIASSRDGSNNITITWARRDRLYQGSISGTDLPNSESILSFRLEFYDITGVTFLFARQVDNAETYLLTATEQTSLSLTPGGILTMKICQVSATVGYGNYATAKV